ncbi:MAG: hypothetical protein JWO57_1095, partial [Pseudonocardiales bacterium]|nr:hypothetical protein [Pseudonocardiales bacterium]
MFDTDAETAARDVLVRLRRDLNDLQALDPTRLTDDGLLDLMRDFETVKRKLPTVDHALINDLQRRRLAAERGCTSTVTLLVQLLRLHPTEAGERVRAAAALGPRRALTGEVLPAVFAATAAASAAGSISARHAA